MTGDWSLVVTSAHSFSALSTESKPGSCSINYLNTTNSETKHTSRSSTSFPTLKHLVLP